MICEAHDQLCQQIFELCKEIAATRSLIVRVTAATLSAVATVAGAVMAVGVF